VHYVGLGEGVNDLVLFNPENFVDSLLGEDE
jgi:signal recognition particle GTPase